MLKIATHNSATGEKCGTVLSYLVWIFSVNQTKSIKEQYNKGCRFFDIRVRLDKNGIWRCSHGLWTAKPTALEILDQINNFDEPCYIDLTYEKKMSKNDKIEFQKLVNRVHNYYHNIRLHFVNIKLPKWKCVKMYCSVPFREYFMHLDKRSFHTYLPIPWLWKKIYFNKPTFDEEMFTKVDFL